MTLEDAVIRFANLQAGVNRLFLDGVPKGSGRPKRPSTSSLTGAPTVALDTLPQLRVAWEMVGARILC
jgi:hypothetical protein